MFGTLEVGNRVSRRRAVRLGVVEMGVPQHLHRILLPNGELRQVVLGCRAFERLHKADVYRLAVAKVLDAFLPGALRLVSLDAMLLAFEPGGGGRTS
ncbi:hypothetical protein D3C75_1233740 [compost metagenome]